ncbi:necrosis-and ethylene-inducing protein-like protein 1 precursor [Lindgomyces ingoldianus]|uniref:Necrosis-and ethylene-inducing protein-like protein 1 n=1 Tax=Lindgomyces ingoldianus TaxID=673940 RepID=A0ACB6QGV6_9PLEO|nr:necrosis-and ethylene-inducing protein-like protein 1 precursor [Lindgomyces ingoldianus]KAF2465380.1 necrosis-and ethylene-inducing protein-like protein 1 precursor [Lindgomyces ingoldianus]
MFSNIAQLVLGLISASSFVFAAPTTLGRRAVIAHDAVVGFPQTVPAGIAGTLYLKYKPYLDVFNGCVPFPAVDAAGNTGGGLAPTGSSNGGCSSSTGQVYSRAASYNGAYAIMYSWYMPKDSPSDGLGHRHDWENIVVWLTSQSTTATVRGVAISAHGEYQKVTGHFSGARPLIGYISYWPLDHQLIDTGEKGGEQPLVAWESLTSEARAAIEGTDFGSATPSFRDSNFQSYLADAFI